MEDKHQQFKDKLNKYRIKAHEIGLEKNNYDEAELGRIWANALFSYLYELYRCDQIDEDRALNIMKKYYKAEVTYLLQLISYTVLIRDIIMDIKEAKALIGVKFNNINPLDLFYTHSDYSKLYDNAFAIMLVSKIIDKIAEKTNGATIVYNIILDEAAKLHINTNDSTFLIMNASYGIDEECFDFLIQINEFLNKDKIIKYTGGIIPTKSWHNNEINFFYNNMKRCYVTVNTLYKANIIGVYVDRMEALALNTYIRLAKLILTGDSNI